MSKGWIGVDFDGTLVTYDGWKGPYSIGEPIPRMINRVKEWLRGGADVRIVTARVADPAEAEQQRALLGRWCHDTFGQYLPIQNTKDKDLLELWDDRAVQVEKNTGRMVLEVFEDEYHKRVEAQRKLYERNSAYAQTYSDDWDFEEEL